MTNEMNRKIGKYATTTTHQQWPDLTISGKAYSRPITTIGLGAGDYFIVQDVFPVKNWREELAKAKTAVAGMNAPPKVTPKRGADND